MHGFIFRNDICMLPDIYMRYHFEVESTPHERMRIANMTTVAAIINLLKSRNVKHVAFDFDQTILKCHTGGFAPNIEALKNSISPDFLKLSAELKNEGISMSIVTYADPNFGVNKTNKGLAGPQLVSTGLELNNCSIKDFKDIICKHPHFMNEDDAIGELPVATLANGKRYHLNKLMAQLSLQPNELVLVDDDPRNCAVAVRDGHIALEVTGRKGIVLNELRLHTPAGFSEHSLAEVNKTPQQTVYLQLALNSQKDRQFSKPT